MFRKNQGAYLRLRCLLLKWGEKTAEMPTLIYSCRMTQTTGWALVLFNKFWSHRELADTAEVYDPKWFRCVPLATSCWTVVKFHTMFDLDGGAISFFFPFFFGSLAERYSLRCVFTKFLQVKRVVLSVECFVSAVPHGVLSPYHPSVRQLGRWLTAFVWAGTCRLHTTKNVSCNIYTTQLLTKVCQRR